MGITIVSINRITKAGYTVSFEGDSCKIKNQHGATIGTIPVSSNGLYKVDCAYVMTFPFSLPQLITESTPAPRLTTNPVIYDR